MNDTTDIAAKKENQPIILQYLDRFKDQIAAALPRHMTPDRMARIVTTEVRKTPKLLQCNPKSLFGAVIQASQLGLEPGSALGHAYLIPYGKDVNLIIGYRGMIDMARRSGQIISIEARPVFEGDTFTYSFGLEPDLQHTPGAYDVKNPLTHVYAVAKLKGGGTQWDVMTKAEVEAIRQASQGRNSSPWQKHFTEMAKKTVIRRLFKYLPVSIEMQTAVGLDEQADAGVAQNNDACIDGDFMVMDEAPEEKPISKTESIKKKLKDDSTEDTGEITYPYVRELIEKAATKDDLDLAESMVSVLDEKFHKELIELVLSVREKMAA